jgi:glycosyltransferase involved in cell wall biosynthesis
MTGRGAESVDSSMSEGRPGIPESARIACFMPAYNAEDLMEDVIRRIGPHWDFLSRLLVVDDGSADGTAETALRLASEFPLIELARHETNSGYGAAQKTAFRWALENGMDAVVMLHSDGQYPPELLDVMVEPLFDGADVVGGSRSMHGGMRKGGMSLPRFLGTVALNGLENLVFRQRLTSYHSGYKSYSRRAMEVIPFERYSDTFNFDSEMLVGAIRNRLPIREVPIPTIHGEGYSSLKPIPYGISVLHTVLRYILGRI